MGSMTLSLDRILLLPLPCLSSLSLPTHPLPLSPSVYRVLTSVFLTWGPEHTIKMPLGAGVSCMCMCEREKREKEGGGRERARERQTDRETDRQRE